MIRRITIAAFTIGAVLCVAAWVITLWVTPYYKCAGPRAIGIVAGCLGVGFAQPPVSRGWHFDPAEEPQWMPFFDKHPLGYIVGMPLWVPFLALAAYPAAAFIRGPLRRWRRREPGTCVRCGYNLTGNVSGVCPECGTAT